MQTNRYGEWIISQTGYENWLESHGEDAYNEYLADTLGDVLSWDEWEWDCGRDAYRAWLDWNCY